MRDWWDSFPVQAALVMNWVLFVIFTLLVYLRMDGALGGDWILVFIPLIGAQLLWLVASWGHSIHTMTANVLGVSTVSRPWVVCGEGGLIHAFLNAGGNITFLVFVGLKLDGSVAFDWSLVFLPFFCSMAVHFFCGLEQGVTDSERALVGVARSLVAIFLTVVAGAVWLKLDDVVDWEWVIVLVPVWILLGLVLVAAIVFWLIVLQQTYVRYYQFNNVHDQYEFCGSGSLAALCCIIFVLAPAALFLALLAANADNLDDSFNTLFTLLFSWEGVVLITMVGVIFVWSREFRKASDSNPLDYRSTRWGGGPGRLRPPPLAPGHRFPFKSDFERDFLTNKPMSEHERGALKKRMFRLPRTSRPLPSQMCVLCRTSFHFRDILTYLPCGHRFHQECAESWLATTDRCPIDRRPARRPKEVHVYSESDDTDVVQYVLRLGPSGRFEKFEVDDRGPSFSSYSASSYSASSY